MRRTRCRTESYALNVMDKEPLPVLLVLEPAKDHSRARYSVTVKIATELDGVVARSVAVLARSNQQIQKWLTLRDGLSADARMKSWWLKRDILFLAPRANRIPRRFPRSPISKPNFSSVGAPAPRAQYHPHQPPFLFSNFSF